MKTENGNSMHLIPMLWTKPMETRSSIACQVDSKDIVVSMSSTPSSPKALSVVPTPASVRNMSQKIIEIKINDKDLKDLNPSC